MNKLIFTLLLFHPLFSFSQESKSQRDARLKKDKVEQKSKSRKSSNRNSWKNTYDDIGGFSEGLSWVKKDGYYGFVNLKGELIIPIEFSIVSYFLNGFASVGKNSKYGYINNKGEIVIPFIYDYCGLFSDNYKAKVLKDNKYYWINKQGECIKDCP